MIATPALLSIQIAVPEMHQREGKPWRTGYFKQAVSGPVQVALDHLAGDGSAALGPHGGTDRVVLAYPAAHYDLWRAEFPDAALSHGAMGENFTVAGLDEAGVCQGDRHHFGEVILEVTMPRVPCANISHATGVATLFERAQATRRIGWLYRVIQPGMISAGSAIALEPSTHPSWNMARVYQVYRRVRKNDFTVAPEAAELAGVAALPADWQKIMNDFVAKAAAAARA